MLFNWTKQDETRTFFRKSYFCPIKSILFNLLRVFDLFFSECLQSTLFQISCLFLNQRNNNKNPDFGLWQVVVIPKGCLAQFSSGCYTSAQESPQKRAQPCLRSFVSEAFEAVPELVWLNRGPTSSFQSRNSIECCFFFFPVPFSVRWSLVWYLVSD